MVSGPARADTPGFFVTDASHVCGRLTGMR